jgi:hypothetical protein
MADEAETQRGGSQIFPAQAFKPLVRAPTEPTGASSSLSW